jgi:hypothetical protein
MTDLTNDKIDEILRPLALMDYYEQTKKSLAHLIHQAEIKAVIDALKSTRSCFDDLQNDEEAIYIKNYIDDDIKALEKEIV